MDSYNPDMEIDSVETQPIAPRAAPSRRNADKPPKLRSSCDICANAKVKCDRERPVCQRCINTGMRCNYSVSRRMGKPPRKDANGNPLPKKSDAKVPERRSTISSTPELDQQSFLDDQQLGGGIPDPLQDPNFESSLLNFEHTPTLPWHDLNFMSDPQNFCSTDDFLSSSALLALESSMSFMDNWGTADQGNGLTRVSSASETFSSDADAKAYAHPADQSPSPPPSATQATARHQHSIHGRKESCSNLASTTLQNLHLPQNFCQSNPTSAPKSPGSTSSIDQVLATNRRAIQTFNQLLQCPCSSNSGLVLALSLIILKILSCYTAIGRSTSSSRTTPGSVMSDLASGSSTPWEDREMVLDIPISMGAYQIDAEDEMHLKLQLVINELRKVQKLIDAFAGRYCRGGPGGDGIYGALEKFLRQELKTANKELNTALRNSEDA
ncbi:hypothetical protein BCR34DRAFT_195699 [Clohesyomyces aquaticus]|uniref:Zn(2)-C6 fungal-type domain-containing protein n=1 Tax=Clohesyomyces aquaticus TaxID=1231657 RepID=A0A1Y1YBK5_9PLEO|nr:hypothetical protein BCR34DRAFT_195699 [Clohesyomyces aquaticus]